MAESIRTKKARADRLKPRDAPYYETLSKGCALGFRKSPSGAETWLARFRDRRGKQHWQPLGEFDEYDDARKAAEEWFAKMDGAAVRAPKRGTVADALRAYLTDLRDGGRDDAANDAAAKYKACRILHDTDADELAAMALEATTKEDFRAYRSRLRGKNGRGPKTVNRYMRQIAAGLNHAIKNGHVGNPAAWTLPKLSSDKSEESENAAAVFLTPVQRERLTKNCPAWLKQYVSGLYASGARPSELARANVKHYDPRRHTLSLFMRKGNPPEWRERIVELNPIDKPLFLSMIKDKMPEAPLVMNADGERLARHQWAKALREAIEFANAGAKPAERIPEQAGAYSYRHTRISELLQVFEVDAMTVADQTGTSLAMMKLYYWKFIPSAIREKFDRHSKKGNG